MTVSILIVNWNGKKYIYDCLESIRQHVTVPYEVIVVDNHSTDGSADEVERRFPWVKLIRSGANLGFAGGNNLGARHASGKYLLLLNNDTLLQTDIADALAIAEADRKVGAVGALMFYGDGSLRPSAFKFPTPMRLWRIASLAYSSEIADELIGGVPVRRCDFVEGSFLLTPAAAWQAVSGMDERNFMYCEDADYGRSISDAGYKSVQSQTVRYTHFCGYNHARMAYLFSGFRRYHRKFSGPLTRAHAEFVLRAGLLLRLPWYWLKGLRGDEQGRVAFQYALRLHRNWKRTGIEGVRHQS
ncbi:MAG TPA: glycosyltransferase family 2 protein [Terracidiphilus sp.]|jgi:hypothetical protein|nr:glycosyltransferase family 2 protein [Terracidiphilus sp.]